MLFFVHAAAIGMGFYMVRYVSPRNLDVRAGDLHPLDIVFISLVFPSLAFMLVFFIVGNVWFFWFDDKTAFVGSNRIRCQSATRFGFAAITMIWVSTPLCSCCSAYYIRDANKEDLREFKRLLEDAEEDEEDASEISLEKGSTKHN